MRLKLPHNEWSRNTLSRSLSLIYTYLLIHLAGKQVQVSYGTINSLSQWWIVMSDHCERTLLSEIFLCPKIKRPEVPNCFCVQGVLLGSWCLYRFGKRQKIASGTLWLLGKGTMREIQNKQKNIFLSHLYFFQEILALSVCTLNEAVFLLH